MRITNGAVVLTPGKEIASLIKQTIPKAALGSVAGETAVAVRHKLEETLVLRNIGFDVPSPIAYGWKYPGMYKPRDNQYKTSAFMTLYRRAFILNAMRTGKTASALWASEYLLQEGFVRRVLVVCPKTCMRLVWATALFECLPHRSVAMLHGSKEQRLRALDKGTEYCIINHDGIAALSDKVRDTRRRKVTLDCAALRGKFDLIIYDEADAVANHRNEAHKALASLIRPETWLWLMTGTPTGGKYCDTWGLLKLVRTTMPVPSWTQYREQLMYKVDQFKWVNREGAEKLVYEYMQPAIRFTQAECFDLPAVQFVNRGADLTVEQKRAYLEMQRVGMVELEGIKAKNAAIKMLKLLQISCGAVRDDDGKEIILDSKGRIQALEEILAELGVTTERGSKKTIIAMPFTYSMENLRSVLVAKGYRVALVNGAVHDRERARIFKGWAGDEFDIVLVHPEVTAHGLDLTAAESIIYYAPIFGNKLFGQLNMRIQGERQKGKPVIIFLSCTKLERDRYAALQAGVASSEALLDMYSEALREEIA